MTKNRRFAIEKDRKNPEYMTEDILRSWLDELNLPRITDVYEAATNHFYISFEVKLKREDMALIAATGISAEETPPLRNRYYLVWRPVEDAS